MAAALVDRGIVSSVYASEMYLEQENLIPDGPGYPKMSAVYGAEIFD
jgi:hypothetical protein